MEYKDLISRLRKLEKRGTQSEGTIDVVGEKPSSSERAANAAIQSASSGGSGSEIAANALVASGNPYAAGGGAVLSVLSSAQRKRDEEAKAKTMAAQRRIENQQLALDRLTSVSQGLKRL